MRRFVSLSAFLLAVFLMLFLAPPVVSNSALTLTPTVVPQTPYWFYLDGATLYRRDMLNLVDKPVVELTQFESVLPCYILSNRDVTRLYVLWYECYDGKVVKYRTHRRLVEIDVQQARRRTLFEKNNIFDLHLSPDESKLVILYYEGDLWQSAKRMVMLSLQSGTLMEFDVALSDSYTNRVEWLDETYLIVSYRHGISKLDTRSGAVTSIPTPDEYSSIDDTAVVKDKHQLLMAARPRGQLDAGDRSALSLWLYDFDTDRLTQLPFQTSIEGETGSISQLTVSPDGKYIIYLIASSGLRPYFEIGNLVTNERFAPPALNNQVRLPGALFWSDDGQIIMTAVDKVTYVDLTNGNLTSLDVKR